MVSKMLSVCHVLAAPRSHVIMSGIIYLREKLRNFVGTLCRTEHGLEKAISRTRDGQVTDFTRANTDS